MNEAKLKELVRQAVREELEDFYRKLASLVEAKADHELSHAEKEVLELIKDKERTAEELAGLRGTSREASVQVCQKLWSSGYIDKIRKGKKIFYLTRSQNSSK